MELLLFFLYFSSFKNIELENLVISPTWENKTFMFIKNKWLLLVCKQRVDSIKIIHILKDLGTKVVSFFTIRPLHVYESFYLYV